LGLIQKSFYIWRQFKKKYVGTEMEKPIIIIFLPQAEDFVDGLELNARRKLFSTIRKTKERVIGHWFIKLKDSEGIFEFRVNECGKFYRLFSFWDTESDTETMVVATHGIAKKKNQTPKEEIRKAERIRKEYFEQKNSKR
jgi:phage-related protein